jgi:hypothetical protein
MRHCSTWRLCQQHYELIAFDSDFSTVFSISHALSTALPLFSLFLNGWPAQIQ